MKERCDNPKNSHYHMYGGRGIAYDPEWSSFEAFLRDMGHRPEGKTLDRVNNDLGYSKNNCRWVSRAEQSRNTTRSVYITYNGVTRCVKDWAILLGITDGALKARLERWPVDIAMSASKNTSIYRGSENLSRENVAKIQKDGRSSRAIARDYGVSPNSVMRVKNGLHRYCSDQSNPKATYP